MRNKRRRSFVDRRMDLLERPLLLNETQDDLQENFRLLDAIGVATLVSIPLWSVVLWFVL